MDRVAEIIGLFREQIAHRSGELQEFLAHGSRIFLWLSCVSDLGFHEITPVFSINCSLSLKLTHWSVTTN